MTHKKDYRVIEECNECGQRGSDSWNFVDPDKGIRKHIWSTEKHWECNFCHHVNCREGEDIK